MVATLLLGLAVGVIGFFALLMWADARDSRDEASAVPASEAAAADATHEHAATEDHNVALPLASFAGVVPDNATELAEAHVPYDATLPPLTQGDVVKVNMVMKQKTVEIAPGVKYDVWAFDTKYGAPGPVVHVREGQTVEFTLTNGAHDRALDGLPRGADRPERRLQGRPARRVLHLPLQGRRPGRLHVPLRDEAGARAHRERHVRRDHRPAERHAARRQRVRARRERVVPERRRHLEARHARHGEGARNDARLDDLQRLREPVRHAPADRRSRARPRASGSSQPARRSTRTSTSSARSSTAPG